MNSPGATAASDPPRVVQELERDLARRKELERALFRVVGELGNGFAITDERGRFLYANEALCRMYGYTEAELLGLPSFVEIVAPDERGETVRRLRESQGAPVASSEPATGTTAVLRKDGHRVDIEYATKTILLDGERRWVSVVRDVTERRRAEAAARERSEQAREIERLRELDLLRARLLNTAAHELNTPLTPIMVHLHLLRSGLLGDMPERQRHAVDVVDRNLTRVTHLVQDLLETARLQNNRVELKVQAVDVGRLLQDAVDTFRGQAEAAGIALEVTPSFGPVADADPRRLMQVVVNLVSNALKFTPRGGRITVGAARVGDRARVTVRDTGVGLGPHQVPLLFQPFSQAHADRRDAPAGTGLGLYISKGLIELHGGRIWAESEGPGAGSAFVFELPLVRAATVVTAARTAT